MPSAQMRCIQHMAHMVGKKGNKSFIYYISLLLLTLRRHSHSEISHHLSPNKSLPKSSPKTKETEMPCCFDCRFFHTSSGRILEESDWDEVLPGECQFHPPTVGDLIKIGTDDEERWFGNYPKVMASDSCGHFEPERRESEFETTILVAASVACDVGLPGDVDAANTESTPHAATWASWATHAVATWQHAENRDALHA